MKWISVNDYLPDADFEVLVCFDDVVQIDIMRQGPVHGDYWFDSERDSRGAINITHWMPLPEPPQD